MRKLLSLLFLVVIFISCSSTNPVVQFRGVNVAGAEMDYAPKVLNPVLGSDYLFISKQDVDYLVKKNVNFLRVLFSWEAVQPDGINTPLATAGNSGVYVKTFFDIVNYATSKGMFVMIEPHGGSSPNFARYKGNLVGSAAVPNTAFANLWSQLAYQFKNNPNVGYGLSNEPNNMGTAQWYMAAADAVSAIRATGSTQKIFVPGNGWTGAGSWKDTWYDTSGKGLSNAIGWLTYIKGKDPLNNTLATVHLYFDTDAGGGTTQVVSPTIGAERAKVVVDWAKANGVKVNFGEFGCATSNPVCVSAVSNLMTYLNANADVVDSWAFWTYGPPSWWGGYQFTLCPSSNYGVDSTQMKMLSTYLPSNQPTPAPTVSSSVDSGIVADSGLDLGVSDAGVKDAGVIDSGLDAGVVDGGTPDGGTNIFTTRVNVYNRWNGGYCAEIYVNNTATTNLAWHSMDVSMNGGSLRDTWLTTTTSKWGATGTITFKPGGTPSNQWIKAGSSVKIGFCSDNKDKTKSPVVVLVK